MTPLMKPLRALTRSAATMLPVRYPAVKPPSAVAMIAVGVNQFTNQAGPRSVRNIPVHMPPMTSPNVRPRVLSSEASGLCQKHEYAVRSTQHQNQNAPRAGTSSVRSPTMTAARSGVVTRERSYSAIVELCMCDSGKYRVQRTGNRFPTGAGCDFDADRHPIGVLSDPQICQDNNLFEISQAGHKGI